MSFDWKAIAKKCCPGFSDQLLADIDQLETHFNNGVMAVKYDVEQAVKDAVAESEAWVYAKVQLLLNKLPVPTPPNS